MKNSIQIKAADTLKAAHGYSASVVRLRNTSAVSIDYSVSGGSAVELAAGASAVVDVAALTSEISVRRTDLSATPVDVILEFGLDPDEAYVLAVEKAPGSITSVSAADITDLASGRGPLLTGTPAQARAAIGAGAAGGAMFTAATTNSALAAINYPNLLNRAPTTRDAAGYDTSSIWQYAKALYSPAELPSGSACWKKTVGSPSALPATIAPAPVFTGGLVRLVDGYTGNACDVSVTISGVATEFSIGLLDSGKLDERLMAEVIAKADAGTAVRVVKLYDQSGSENHATKHASYAAPFIAYDNALGSYCIFGEYNGPQTLRFPTTMVITENAVTVSAFGRGTISRNSALVSLGDYTEEAPNNRMIAMITSGATGGVTLWSSATGVSEPKDLGGNSVPVGCEPTAMTMAVGVSSMRLSVNHKAVTFSKTFSANTYRSGWLFAQAPSITNRAAMRITEITIWGSALSSANQDALQKSMYLRYNSFPQVRNSIFAIGDSRLSGVGTVGFETIADHIFTKCGNNYRVVNYGKSGETSSGIMASVPSIIGARSTGCKNIACVLLGVNDLLVSAVSASESVSRLSTVCSSLKAGGITVLLIAEISASNPVTAAYLAEVRAAILAAGPASIGCDIILDVSNSPQVMDGASAAYYSDGLHITSALSALIADRVLESITGL